MKRPFQILVTALNSLSAVILPATCKLCQTQVEDLRLGVVCQSCWDSLKVIEAPWCGVCGYAFPSKAIDPNQALCGACRRGLYRFDVARAYGPFQDSLREIIHHLKYGRHPSLARPLAVRLTSVYEAHRHSLQADWLIPVPLHPARERERGFNQAVEISRHFSRLAGVPLAWRWLLRTRPTQVQAGLTRRERRSNVNGAFDVSKGAEIQGKTLLVIDDVFTTGATLNECARILKQRGAAKVAVLSVARVIKE
ncbi:MAG: ComF family protein [Acidobacteriales bacterium]|nr:ComF family protein [Terriglobales bacterium]MCI0419140.1 ComF family protein [Acidobacteriota bacterium]MCI0626927.1 ComF family protein [Acidobacteriota bacterium]MCI0718994.1 ComF family protein [Acidobacteriota bacterium]